MWEGKNKALTFSFDDGVKQDVRAIEIMNKYRLKGTFNLNSGYFGLNGQLNINGTLVQHNKILASDVRHLYLGHEVAVHTLTHPNLTELDSETIVRQVEEDRKALEQLCGYPIRGMAYPCGGVNNDDRVAGVIAKNTPIRYARTITSSHSFDLQSNLLRFQPTVYHIESCLFDIAEKFLREPSDGKPKLLYIWGHTYEMDANLGTDWAKFEELCKLLSGKDDIFYGTNSQVLL